MQREIINVDGKDIYYREYLPTQQKVLQCIGEMKTPNIMYCGGFGSGKTMLAGEIGLELAGAYPGIEIGYFRKTRTSIKDTTYKTFVNEIVPPEYIKERQKTDLDITLVGGANCHFFGIDNFERKGSLRFDVIVVDEAIELEEEDRIMLEGRLRGQVVPLPQIIYLCNAGAPGSHFWRLFPKNETLPIGQRDLSYKYFTTTSFENTYNPEAYRERLRKWEGTQYYSRYVLSLWTAMRGQVWQNFNPEIHVIAPFEIPANWPKNCVVDFGFDNPLSLLWIATDPATDIKYVYRQLYRTGLLVRQACLVGKTVSQKAGERINEIRADHDAENRAQFEVYWMPTRAAKKDVMPGLQAVEERLMERPDGKRGLYIFNDDWSERDGYWYGNIDKDPVLAEENKPCCLQEEIPLYKFGKNDAPVKENDHACDALRYDIYTDNCDKGRGEGFGKVRCGQDFARQ